MANLREAFEYASKNPDSDFAKNLAELARSGSLNLEAKKYGIDLTAFQPAPVEAPQPEKPKQNVLQKVDKGLTDFGVGVGKGVTETAVGLGQLALRGASNLPLPKKDIEIGGITLIPSKEKALQAIETGEDIKNTQLKPENMAEGVGKFAEQVAEYAVPATKVTKVTKALPFAGKVAARAATAAGVASAQAGKVGKEAIIAAGVETAIPVAGRFIVKPVKNFVGRLIKGLSSGLSGVGTDTIDKIITNPKVASQTAKALTTEGNAGILKKNAEVIMNGISNIKKEARKAFGTGLEALQKTDIDEKTFTKTAESLVSKFEGGKNMEFSDPKNVKKATELLNGLSKVKLDGKSLRGYIDKIESPPNMYKIATSEERLSYNAFSKELASSIKDVISKSTPKLNEINKAFSKDISLAESIEGIFGKVKFKNATEINKIAQKLETVFSQKGLSPQYLDDFFNRLGIKPQDFKTSEAVRQITNKVSGANTRGLSVGEIMQQVTSSVITPRAIRNIAIFVGKSEQFIRNLHLEKLTPSARAILIKTLIPVKKDSQD